MSFGVQSTGYVRKPLSVILAEIEAAMISEFGPGVIQTAQSPFGQLNGLAAALTTEVLELCEDIYQSVDPDQAEGKRLDMLGRIRLAERGSLTDPEYRRIITNAGNARIDISDIITAVRGLPGVTYAYVFTNETGEIVNESLEAATIAVAVIGGEDEDIADAMRQYIVPGISTYGNYQVVSDTTGFCRSFNIIRPIDIPVTLTIEVRISQDKQGCPAPTVTTIRDELVSQWPAYRLNGMDVTAYHVRSIIEAVFSSVEVFRISAIRDSGIPSSFADISFIEIASLAAENVTVTVVTT